jgi:hypothetical protein
MYSLQNERLKVKISEPGEIYKGSRFDWYGMITEIILDGKHSFCMPESLIPGIGTDGQGLYNEFGIESPIGYDEAAVGEKFPKLGIGLLTRYEHGTYKFSKPYEIEPFKANISSGEHHVTFDVLPLECRGYAARLIKTITIKENSLKIDYCLENTGTKAIKTTEYCHNFVGINEKAIGADYEMKFSFTLNPDREQKTFKAKENKISWDKPVEEEFYCKFIDLPEGNNASWELIHKSSGVGMRETVNFRLHDFAIWGRPHVVSPEAFINIDLAPGESMKWERVYEFFTV